VGEADREHEQHQRKRAAAHEDAAAVHDQAATTHQHAAEFSDERGEPGKADREPDLADREARGTEDDRREPAAELEDLSLDASTTAWSKRWSLTWRLGLIGIAAVLVVGSFLRIRLDAHQVGPYVHDNAQSYTLDKPFSDEFFSTGGYEANVSINFSALDVANSSMTTRLAIELSQPVVSGLVLSGHSASSPLNASNSRQWMGLPVTLQLVMCHYEFRPDCMSASSLQIRLGDLLMLKGGVASAALVTRQLDLFADANPGAFPQDKYVVSLDPELFLPDGVKLTGTSGSSFDSVVVGLNLSRGTGLVDKRVVVLHEGIGQEEFGYQVVVSRERLDQYLTYAMSLTPAFLGLLVLCLAFGLGRRLDFGLTVILGLLTAWLTILPLRAVLVPAELGATPLTRADDLLILDAALVLLFTVLAFAWITWIVPRSRH
jgi:hypothetical protein